MSKFDDLINKLCPDGVEWKKIREIISYTRGKGLSKEVKGTGNNPIILYGELYTTYGNYIESITSFAADEFIKTSVKIKKGSLLLPISSTTKEAQIGKASVLKVDECYLGGDAISLYPNENINPDFLMYLINGSVFENLKMKCVKGTTIRHLDPGKLQDIEIPVPPLEIQNEIVRILDNFTELEEELEEELEARRKQYEYYRDSLLSFDDSVEWKTIGDITNVFSAKRVYRDQWQKQGVPFWRSSDLISFFNGVENTRGKAYISEELYESLAAISGKIQKDDILITGGGTIGIPYIVPTNDPLYVKDGDLLCIQHNDFLDSRFLYHYFLSGQFRKYLSEITHDATIAHYTIIQIRNTPVPIPNLEKQKMIATVLDRFEALCNDITSGLPAEIEARHKQYEYYRDKLLTFKKKSA